jgi:hypothetical protein
MANDYASNVFREARSLLEPRKRWLYVYILPGVVIVGRWGHRAIMDATAEKRVTKVCVALTPGMSMADVLDFADSHGMYKPPYGATLYFMGEKASSNHYGCRLEFREGILQSSIYLQSSNYDTANPK